jgi:hypothetical protein
MKTLTFSFSGRECRNPSLGFDKGWKVVGQVGDPGVTSHAPGSVKSVRESTLTLLSELSWWEFGVPSGLSKFQRVISRVKIQWLVALSISLQSSWNVDV